MSRGRHARPSTASKALAAGTTACTGAAAAGAIAVTVTSGHGAPAVHAQLTAAVTQQVKAVDSSFDISAARGNVARPARPAAPSVYSVRSGDTLSGISGTYCGSPGKYPNLAGASGIANPNVIDPGQRVVLDCTHAPAAVTASYSAPVQHSRPDSDWGDSQPAQPVTASYTVGGGNLGYSGLEGLWESAGGPSWAAPEAATVAECESGGRQYAENPSGASGYWQILGEVVAGNVFDPMVNAENAVAKFKASSDTFAQWVCQP